MRDGAGSKRARVLSQNGDEVIMRIALMQKDRLADARGDLELSRERGSLHVAGRKIPKVIEPAFSNRNDFGLAGETFELVRDFVRQLGGVVWVDARGCEQPAWMLVSQRYGSSGAFGAGTRDDHLHHARRGRTGHYRLAIAVITVVREVDSDVDQYVRSGG
jgi:hypothetical protein